MSVDLRLILAPGNHASRPAASAVAKGALYFCSDHNTVYRSDLSTWTQVATNNSSAGTVTSVSGTAPISVANPTTTPAITHDVSGVSAGTSSGITVDTKGHVTARTALVAADIPALTPVLVRTAQSGALTLTSAHALIVSDGGNITFPSAAANPGRMYWIITANGEPTVIANGSDELIDMGNDLDGGTLFEGAMFVFVSDGVTRWYTTRTM